MSYLWLVLSVTLWHICCPNFDSFKKLDRSIDEKLVWASLCHSHRTVSVTGSGRTVLTPSWNVLVNAVTLVRIVLHEISADLGTLCYDFLMRKERDRQDSDAFGLMSSSFNHTTCGHPSPLPPSSFLPHNPSLHSSRMVLSVLFPAVTQWRHGAVSAEQHTVWFCPSQLVANWRF